MSSGVITTPASIGRGSRVGPDRDTVCLWWADLDWSDEEIASGVRDLSADERDRAGRYLRRADRARFIAARTCLRNILSFCLGVPAVAITFELGQHGKPRLTSEFARHNIHFNVAHSHGLGVFAVTIDREIGVDVERIEPNRRCLELAYRFFAREEQEAIQALAAEDQLRAFHRCWTRKEAFLKAIGAGLYVSLDSFVVSVTEEDLTFSARAPFAAAKYCRLTDISPGADFAAAFAILDSTAAQPQIAEFRWTYSGISPIRNSDNPCGRFALEGRTGKLS